jgi:hypothetical protein
MELKLLCLFQILVRVHDLRQSTDHLEGLKKSMSVFRRVGFLSDTGQVDESKKMLVL